MNAYVLVEKGKTIEPFGDHPRNCLVTNRKLSEHQKEVLDSLGIIRINFVYDFPKPNAGEEYIVFGESLFFTWEFLSLFIAKARKGNRTVGCKIRKGLMTLRSRANLQNVEDIDGFIGLNLWYFPPNPQETAKPQSVLMECDQFDCYVPIPCHMCGDSSGYMISMTDTFAVQIDHWVNLWVTNVFMALANVARIRKMSKWKLAPWKIFRNLNKFGKNCKVHRSAKIEASIIGDNVTIEAGAVVKASIIGSNAHIGSGVVVEESILGDGCKILHGHILFSALGPGTFSVTDFVSASIAGKDVFIGANAVLTDFRFDGKNVIVMDNGKKTDSGNLFLGACLGHKVYIGAQCAIAPGRAVPNGLRICRKDMYAGRDSDKENFQIEPF